MLQLQFVLVPLALVLVGAVTVVFFGLAARAARKPSRWHYTARSWSDSGWSFGAILGAASFAILLLVTIIMLIPFNSTYWTYSHVEGTIQTVSNRFVEGTGDLSSDYVLRIEGMPGVYNVQDNRIQGVKIGDPVDLTCTVQWVYAGQDQNNCFIRSWVATR